MLVLSRRVNERVIITVPGPEGQATTIEVVVTDVIPVGRRVRIGFKAPSNVKIYREELVEDNEPS